MGMLPTHPSKALISSVVGRSTKDEKSNRFHCLMRASVTSNQDWGNRLLTHPAEPTLILQLVLSTTESLPRQHSLAHHSPGQEFSILSLVALRPESSPIHKANVSAPSCWSWLCTGLFLPSGFSHASPLAVLPMCGSPDNLCMCWHLRWGLPVPLSHCYSPSALTANVTSSRRSSLIPK